MPSTDANVSGLKLKEAEPRQGFFEHADFLDLRDALPEYLRGYLTFSYVSGWRKREITGLRWGDNVDRERGTVILAPHETKNKKARLIVLDDELKEIIERQWRKRIETGSLLPWVFPNYQNDGRISDFRTSWHTALKKVGLDGKLLHDNRRTAVRNLVRAGVPENIAMAATGHLTRSVFDRYDIINEDDMKMAAEMREAYLKILISKNGSATKSHKILELEPSMKTLKNGYKD